MQSRGLSWMIALVGLTLVVAAFMPGAGTATYAAPPLALTQTAEPPTPTNTPIPTDTPIPTNTPAPTNTPQPAVTPQPGPTNTSVPTNTPEPTNTPRPQSDEKFADPAIVKRASASNVQPGDLLTFTLVVTNLGNATAENVIVTDALPPQVDFIDATTTQGTVLALDGRNVTASLGSLEPGATATVTINVRVNANAVPPGFDNVAVVSTTSPGDNPDNNTSKVTISVGAVAAATATSGLPGTPAVEGTPGVPGATPAPPTVLPPTGGATDMSPLLLLFGLGLVVLSLLLRWRLRE